MGQVENSFGAMTAEEVVNWKHGNLQDSFDLVFMSLKGPKDMAMFGRHDHKSFTYYFCGSGEVELRIMKAALEPYGPVPVKAPEKERTSLLVGNADARDRLLH
ncbi:MAG: hypothetical protein OEY97_11405 [Nitrospirota bacterium]|nr:hypothetical protein [Nitrospirota bacterium]